MSNPNLDLPNVFAHPDLAGMATNADLFYVWQFFNVAIGTGPHICIQRLTGAESIIKYVGMFLMSHPNIRVDWDEGFAAFPSIYAAQAEAAARKETFSIRYPDRVGAEEMFPDAPNRVFEAGKDELNAMFGATDR